MAHHVVFHPGPEFGYLEALHRTGDVHLAALLAAGDRWAVDIVELGADAAHARSRAGVRPFAVEVAGRLLEQPSGQFADATRHVGTTWLCDTARHTLGGGWLAPRQYGRRPCICVCHAAATRGREPWSSMSVRHLSYPYPESPAAGRRGDSSPARHLPGCVPAVPDAPGCEAVRAEYGICPDHDGLCAPGCPVGHTGGNTG